MSRTLKGLLVGMLLLAPVLAQAAPGEMLEVKGRLAATDPLDPVRRKPAKIHEVKLSKGKAYQIDLLSNQFDAYLRLVNAAGAEVAFDDDGGAYNQADAAGFIRLNALRLRIGAKRGRQRRADDHDQRTPDIDIAEISDGAADIGEDRGDRDDRHHRPGADQRHQYERHQRSGAVAGEPTDHGGKQRHACNQQ